MVHFFVLNESAQFVFLANRDKLNFLWGAIDVLIPICFFLLYLFELHNAQKMDMLEKLFKIIQIAYALSVFTFMPDDLSHKHSPPIR
jgi:hypothetical protein